MKALLIKTILIIAFVSKQAKACDEGYYQNSEGNCFLCVKNCESCSSNSDCIRCKDDYKWEDSKFECQRKGHFSTFAIVVIAISGAAAIMMVTILIFAYRSHRRHARLILAQQNYMHQLPTETVVQFTNSVVMFEPGKD